MRLWFAYYLLQVLASLSGNVFTLKQLLGHTGLQVTNRYVALAQAELQTQHRRFRRGIVLGSQLVYAAEGACIKRM